MKDDSREIPPARVYGAEKYNVSDARLAANRMARKAGTFLVWLVKLLLAPFRFVGRVAAKVYWGIPKEPRTILFGLSAALTSLWCFAFFGSYLPWKSAGQGFHWWEIPYLLTAILLTIIVGFTSAVMASFTKEEWKNP